MIARRMAACLFGLVLLAAGGAPASAAAAQPVAERGPVTLRAEAGPEDENLQWAASVVTVSQLGAAGDFSGKLFGVAGGDPAMNGLYTYLAFHLSPGDGWRIFKIGDFLDYRVLSETAGRVVIEVEESVIDSESVISARRRRLAITWTPAPGEDAPAAVMVATAP
ncbi:MAG TPA: hypothetical protein VMG08_13355 [Allosphingosinicella sp.]|nr:hypothetical protein [Allosphingosinicella sp.]